MTTQSDNIDERIAQLVEQQRETHAQTMAELAEIKAISQQQLATANQQLEIARLQSESIRSLATANTFAS